MVKIWGNIIRKNRIVDSCLVTADDEPTLDLYLNSIQSICNELDLEMPVILSKHKNDLEAFNLASFLPTDFIEKIDFQRLDIEIFIDKDKNEK